MDRRKIGCTMLAITALFMPFAGAWMIMEGPHGPQGEITGDPVYFPIGALGCSGGPIVAIIGLYLIF